MNSEEIIKILENLFPLKNKIFDWDNNGKNFYFKEKNVKKCLVVLDITNDVIEYALQKNIKFIISHHPIIFEEYKIEITNSIKKEIFDKIKKNKITCYIIHTNYDYSILGMNYKILYLLNSIKINLLNKNDVAYKGQLPSSKSFKNIIDELVKILSLNYINFIGNINDQIKNIVICSGSGNSTTKFINSDIDLYITGELKWSKIIELNAQKINILLLGHYMESFFVTEISKILKNNLKNVTIIKYTVPNLINILKYD